MNIEDFLFSYWKLWFRPQVVKYMHNSISKLNKYILSQVASTADKITKIEISIKQINTNRDFGKEIKTYFFKINITSVRGQSTRSKSIYYRRLVLHIVLTYKVFVTLKTQFVILVNMWLVLHIVFTYEVFVTLKLDPICNSSEHVTCVTYCFYLQSLYYFEGPICNSGKHVHLSSQWLQNFWHSSIGITLTNEFRLLKPKTLVVVGIYVVLMPIMMRWSFESI
jgi:hypothetical protein